MVKLLMWVKEEDWSICIKTSLAAQKNGWNSFKEI